MACRGSRGALQHRRFSSWPKAGWQAISVAIPKGLAGFFPPPGITSPGRVPPSHVTAHSRQISAGFRPSSSRRRSALRGVRIAPLADTRISDVFWPRSSEKPRKTVRSYARIDWVADIRQIWGNPPLEVKGGASKSGQTHGLEVKPMIAAIPSPAMRV